MGDLDLIVIGCGPAGEKGAAQAAYHGYRVAVVDAADRPGGAPVNTGGIPTKTLRETAEYLTGFRRGEIYGVKLQFSPEFALERLAHRAAQVQTSMAATVQANLDRHGIELIRGRAQLLGDGEVAVHSDGGTRRLAAPVILVATGSRPLRPGSIPFDDPDVHDSDSILELDRIPSSLAVVGAGPVGAEYASIFTALGVEVTLLDAADRIAPLLDAELSRVLEETFVGMGMRVVTGCGQATIARADGRLRVTLGDGRSSEHDKVLFVAGRVGNTEEIGLAEAGVELDERGRIVVDDRLATTSPGIIAAGDVIGPPAIGSVSAEQGRVAVCHALGIPFKGTLDHLPPFGIYSIPEVGMVGMSEESATAAGHEVVVGRAWFADNARSRIAGTTEGLIKLVVDRADRRILGVHILGDDAAELIHVGQLAIQAGMDVERFIDMTFNIPTRTDAYKYAAYDALTAIERLTEPSGSAGHGPDGMAVSQRP